MNRLAFLIITLAALSALTGCGERPGKQNPEEAVTAFNGDGTQKFHTKVTIDEQKFLVDGKPVREVTAFALGIREVEYIHGFIKRIKKAGYNTLRVGSETADWASQTDPILRDLAGPEPLSASWEENLRKVLDTSQLYQGIAVEVVCVFTAKSRPFDFQLALVKRCKQIADNYPHVILTAVNEYSAHSTLTIDFANHLLQALESTPWIPHSTDDQSPSASSSPWRLNQNFADFIAIHPPRNPELNLSEIKQIVTRYSQKPVLFNETTAYISQENIENYPETVGQGVYAQNGGGTVTERRDQVKRFLQNIIKAGAYPCFHSVDLMRAEHLNFWLPGLDNHEDLVGEGSE